MTTLAPITEASSTHSAPDSLGWTRCYDPATVVWHPDNCVHVSVDTVHAATGTYADFVADRRAREQSRNLFQIASATALLARTHHLTPEQVTDRLHLANA